jgi:uncharacterized protein Yka (UPF0111/DUF47 family)
MSSKNYSRKRLEEQIKEAESILQNKKVSIQAIDEYIHLNEELSKHGLSTKHLGKLVNAIKNVEQQDMIQRKLCQWSVV